MRCAAALRRRIVKQSVLPAEEERAMDGPRGPAAPGERGGISPVTMGLLALLAYKTMRGEGPLGGLFR